MSASNQAGEIGTKRAADEEAPEEIVHVYPDSGIGERHGTVPWWLWAVVLALHVWGIYYLIAYWNPPPGSTGP